MMKRPGLDLEPKLISRLVLTAQSSTLLKTGEVSVSCYLQPTNCHPLHSAQEMTEIKNCIFFIIINILY